MRAIGGLVTSFRHSTRGGNAKDRNDKKGIGMREVGLAYEIEGSFYLHSVADHYRPTPFRKCPATFLTEEVDSPNH